MITIFHGDNFVLSRQTLNQLLQRQSGQPAAARLTVKRFEADQLQPETLTQILESTSLFGQDQLLVIHNLLSASASVTKDQLIKIISANQQQTIYLWEKKTLSAAAKKLLPSAQLQEFKTPKIVFTFLDSLKPQSSAVSLKLLHQACQTDAPELVFYLLCRRVSQLIQAKDSPDCLKSSPWQIAKLKAQAQQFNLAQLLAFHQNLIKIDFAVKTGQTDIPLLTQLDLLLTKL